MRIAAVVDIHGNLPALEAVLADIESVGVDHIVCCGDMVLGAPDDRACYYRIMELGVPVIRGNAERYVAEFGTSAADPRWTTEQFGPLQYSVSQFSDAERVELGNLPTTHRLPDAPDVLFYHANPQNDMDILRSWTPAAEIDKNFSGIEAAVFVGGHTHTQYVHNWQGRAIVICGSVGLTNDYAAGAQYVLLEKDSGPWKVNHRDVSYDIGETLKRFEETKYLDIAGPIGRLVLRGAATRTNQLSPFLKWHGSGAIERTFSEAVDDFLNLY